VLGLSPREVDLHEILVILFKDEKIVSDVGKSKYYYMNELDPINACGVYNFKKGSAAKATEYLGA